MRDRVVGSPSDYIDPTEFPGHGPRSASQHASEGLPAAPASPAVPLVPERVVSTPDEDIELARSLRRDLRLAEGHSPKVLITPAAPVPRPGPDPLLDLPPDHLIPTSFPGHAATATT